jgi:hypothetical protein
MTRGSIREYTQAVRVRYLRASKKGKRKILDEFTEVNKIMIRLAKEGRYGRQCLQDDRVSVDQS